MGAKESGIKVAIGLVAVGLMAAVAFSGCLTVRESAYPSAEMNALDSTSTNYCSLAVRGFEAVLTQCQTLDSTSIVYVPGFYGRRHFHPGYYETVRTTTYVPQLVETDFFLKRAYDRLEAAGFPMGANPADYVVEASFSGPFEGERSPGVRALLWLCTALTYDQCDVVYSSRLKIYDNRTGRLVFSREYSQRYDVAVWSPIPLFGPLGFERSDGNFMKTWCLQALTDRMTADAGAFLLAR